MRSTLHRFIVTKFCQKCKIVLNTYKCFTKKKLWVEKKKYGEQWIFWWQITVWEDCTGSLDLIQVCNKIPLQKYFYLCDLSLISKGPLQNSTSNRLKLLNNANRLEPIWVVIRCWFEFWSNPNSFYIFSKRFYCLEQISAYDWYGDWSCNCMCYTCKLSNKIFGKLKVSPRSIQRSKTLNPRPFKDQTCNMNSPFPW